MNNEHSNYRFLIAYTHRHQKKKRVEKNTTRRPFDPFELSELHAKTQQRPKKSAIIIIYLSAWFWVKLDCFVWWWKTVIRAIARDIHTDSTRNQQKEKKTIETRISSSGKSEIFSFRINCVCTFIVYSNPIHIVVHGVLIPK